MATLHDDIVKSLGSFQMPSLDTPKYEFPKFDSSLLENPSHAKYQHKILMEYIADFEKQLNPDEEVALKLACFGQTLLMHVTFIGYHNPNTIQFCGYDNGQYAELIQHVNQLNFLLMSSPKQEPDKPARRIGFTPDNN